MDVVGEDCRFAFNALLASQKPNGESCSFEVMYTYTVTNRNSVDTVEYVKQLWTEFTTRRLPADALPDDPRLNTQKRLVRQMTSKQSRRVEGCVNEDYWVAAYVDATRGGQGRLCDNRDDYSFTTSRGLPPGPQPTPVPPTPRPTRRPTPVPPSPTPRPPTAPTRCNWDVSDSLA